MTARNTWFADYGSGRESSKTMGILKLTSELMVSTIDNQMISNRLAVNATKTQVMCLRTKQNRTQMIKKGDEFDLKLNIKGTEIQEEKKGELLGLNWDRDKVWSHYESLPLFLWHT